MNCEFCGIEFRRDKIGIHVAAKHKKELTTLIINEYRDSDY